MNINKKTSTALDNKGLQLNHLSSTFLQKHLILSLSEKRGNSSQILSRKAITHLSISVLALGAQCSISGPGMCVVKCDCSVLNEVCSWSFTCHARPVRNSLQYEEDTVRLSVSGYIRLSVLTGAFLTLQTSQWSLNRRIHTFVSACEYNNLVTSPLLLPRCNL